MLEVGGVVRILDGRLPGYLGIADIGPVELAEPGVLLNVLPVVAGAEAFGRIGVEEAENDVLGPQREELRELDHALEYFLVDVLGFLVVVEGRVTGEQFVDEDADAPVVDGLAVAGLVCFFEHFGGEVLGGAADGEGAEVVELLGEAEVDEFGEAVGIDHNVFGLEVAEDDVAGVEVADGVEHSGHVKHSGVVVEAAVAGEPGEEFPALDVLEHHVDVLGVLEGGLAA